MTEEKRKAYYSWSAADEAYSAALHRAFGRDACNRRYDTDKSAHPEECQKAYAYWLAKAKVYRETV